MAKVFTVCFHSEGDKIPKEMFEAIKEQVGSFEKTRKWFPKIKLKVRFKSQFCYLDSIEENNNISPLCRLRYFKNHGWSMAFYAWSIEKYTPCSFGSGDIGTIEDAIKACEFCYLN